MKYGSKKRFDEALQPKLLTFLKVYLSYYQPVNKKTQSYSGKWVPSFAPGKVKGIYKLRLSYDVPKTLCTSTPIAPMP